MRPVVIDAGVDATEFVARSLAPFAAQRPMSLFALIGMLTLTAGGIAVPC